MTAWTEYFERPKEQKLPPYLYWVTDWEQWLSFALLSAAVLAAVSSIVRADWVNSMTNLALLSFVGLVGGFLLAHVRKNGWLLQLAALPFGLLLLAWQILAVVPGATYADKWSVYWARMGDWVTIAYEGGISNDPLPFITTVSVLTLLSSYIASWSIFRWRNPWVALVPIGTILFINISFLPDKFDFSLVIFLFCAFLLTMRMTMRRRQEEWERSGVEYPELISLSALHDTAWVAAALLVGAWLIPTANNIPVLDDAWDGTVGDVEGVNSRFDRLFSGVDSKTPIDIRDYDEFYQFRGDLELEGRTLLSVNAPFDATLLRGATYDEYTALGWLEDSRQAAPVELDINADTDPLEIVEQVPSLAGVNGPTLFIAAVETRAETDTIFTIGQPLGANIDADLISSGQPVFRISLVNAAFDRALPEDLQAISAALREADGINPLPLADEDIAERLGEGLAILSVQRDGEGQATEILITRGSGFAYNTAKLEAEDPLPQRSEYASVGLVNLPTSDQLNDAGEEYPAWVVDTYLQLPPDLPQRVADLAAEVILNNITPFEKAVAIQNYLRSSYPLSLNINRAPVGADAVDHFLFESGDGGAYWDYHASAMVVMLRTQGIPSRFVTGYRLNHSDYENGGYRVRETDLFSWAEVYFPGIGWVEFNPTTTDPALWITASVLPGAGQSFYPASLDPADLSALADANDDIIRSLGGEPVAPVDDLGGSGAGEGLNESSEFPTAIVLGVLAVIAGIGLLFAGGNVLWQWTVRGLNYPAQVWEKTVRLASWSGVGVKPSDTPREFARKLSDELPDVKGITEIETAYSRAQFGGKELSADEKKRVDRVWKDVRRALAARLFRIRRG
ncbi:MAG: transglutaminase domain-containing protein [Dehalococcoidia bacterium]